MPWSSSHWDWRRGQSGKFRGQSPQKPLAPDFFLLPQTSSHSCLRPSSAHTAVPGGSRCCGYSDGREGQGFTHSWCVRQNKGQEGGLSSSPARDTWLSRRGIQGLECSSQERASMAHLLSCNSQDSFCSRILLPVKLRPATQRQTHGPRAAGRPSLSLVLSVRVPQQEPRGMATLCQALGRVPRR